MKILLISHFFPPYRTAGTEMRTLGYATELLNSGHDVRVLCAGDWDRGKEYWNGFTDEIFQGIPVRRVHLNWKLAPDPNRRLYNNPIVEKYLLEWLKEWNPQIVHVTSCVTLSASVIHAAKKLQLPIVFTMTDFWSICPKVNLLRYDRSFCDGRTSSWECMHCMMWENKTYRRMRLLLPEPIVRNILAYLAKRPSWGRLRGFRGLLLNMNERKAFLRKTVGAVDCLTAPSAFLANMIEKTGFHKRSIRVIYSGHDLSWLEKMPSRNSSAAIRFGYVGQLIPVKGVDLLISAFISAGIQSKAQLQIYGDAEADPRFVDTLKASTGPGVKFLGSFPHEDLGKILSEIDVLVVPSQWHENNPRVIQEAFAGQTPVVASDVGGISEFVQHDCNGLLFKHDSPEDLARIMKRIVTNTSIISRLRSGIRPPRTMKEEVGDIIPIYQELLSGHPSIHSA